MVKPTVMLALVLAGSYSICDAFLSPQFRTFQSRPGLVSKTVETVLFSSSKEKKTEDESTSVGEETVANLTAATADENPSEKETPTPFANNLTTATAELDISLDEEELEVFANGLVDEKMDLSKEAEKGDEFEGESETESSLPIPLSESEIAENFLFIQSLAAITGRGEQASEQQLIAARGVVAKLEASNPTPDPTEAKEIIEGTWVLTFTDTGHLFRSSPFFMAGRAVCQTPEQAQQFDWFCTMHRRALATSQIGPVRQIISSSKLVSEFEVQAGAVPFLSDLTPFKYSGGLPLTIDGAIVSTADLTTLNATAYELYMGTVQIKGSNLPGVRQILDGGLELQSRMLGDFLESNIDGYSNPRPVVRTTYLSNQFRISRDMDDNIFVYLKTSDSTQPTDYSDIESDLGIPGLLKGFNEAVTRFGL